MKAHLAKIESDKKPREWSVLQMEAPQDLDSDDEDFVCECENCKDRQYTECSKYIEMQNLINGWKKEKVLKNNKQSKTKD